MSDGNKKTNQVDAGWIVLMISGLFILSFLIWIWLSPSYDLWRQRQENRVLLEKARGQLEANNLIHHGCIDNKDSH